MPSLLSAEVAFMPSRVSGHFTTMFLWILASFRPSGIIAPASVEITSALMSPSTMSQIIRTCSSIGRPSLAISDGLVVTPSTTPQLAPFFSSSRFAVSKKNFTSHPPRFYFSLHRTSETSTGQHVLKLADQPQPLEILISPMRLEFDHRPQCLDFECLTGPVKGDCAPPPVSMEVELMGTRLAIQDKTVPSQGREQLASRQASQVRVIDRHTSDNYCHLRLAGHLHLIGRLRR